MREQFSKALDNIREFWNKLSKRSKTVIGLGAGAMLLLAIGMTVFLNLSSNGYRVLYPGGLTSAETTQVYATLQSMDIPAELNARSEILVPANQVDAALLQLAGKGIRTKVPTYGVFLDNAGFTTTEMQRRTTLVFQLQDRIQETLLTIAGIENAIVTLNVPSKSNYVWDSTTDVSTGSVTVTTEAGAQLSLETVAAIKNLVASSVPSMEPNNVTVVDARTGVEMIIEDESTYGTGGYDTRRVDFERTLCKRIEDDIKRLLTPRYGPGGVTAVASVTVDYDQIRREIRTPTAGEDENGIKTHLEEQYRASGAEPAQGLVGEENNTDVPIYPNQTGEGNGTVTDYNRSIDWEVGYVLEQIEKGTGLLKTASVAVLLNDANFTNQRQEEILDLISKATNIDRNAITVGTLDFIEPAIDVGGEETGLSQRTILILAGGGLLLLLIIILIIALAVRGSRKKASVVVAANETVIHDLQAEIDQHKRQLMQSADALNSSKDNAITTEVRTFAKENPDITASLIRSMLKEDD